MLRYSVRYTIRPAARPTVSLDSELWPGWCSIVNAIPSTAILDDQGNAILDDQNNPIEEVTT